MTTPFKLVIVACATGFALLVQLGEVAAQVRQPFPAYRGADGYTYRQDYVSKRPLNGHEGFFGVGPRLRYCSYIRTPNRECGAKGCRVTSWTTTQYCH